MSRTFACGLITAALLGILVGCAPKPAPPDAQGEVAVATKTPTEDQDLDCRELEIELEPALPEIERIEKQKVDAAVTVDNLGQPNAPSTDTTSLAPPGVNNNPVSNGPTTGEAIGGTGGSNGQRFASFPGRSGVTKSQLLRQGGGNDGPRVKPGGAGAKFVPQDGHDGANAEKYGMYRENEFSSPLVAALSTFSADVNTASYSNVRRMLNQGTLPPKDAVFLAEFVNYFPYKYATPKGDDPIEFNLEMGPCPWNRKHHLVRVGVQASQIEAAKMPPRNLVFLIDTSGSMSSPNRLPLVKQALALLVDQLGEKDRVSIVTYAGDSRVALGPTKGSQKDVIKEVATGLRAEGGTNGEGGITKAYQLARDTFIEGGVNRVILCTDGDFNVGVTNRGDLVRMIEEQRRSKVFLTILGFGMGNYKDDVLKDLANHGNGHHAYIDTLDEAKKVFVEQGGALACVAKDVKFQVDFNPARVAAYRLVGYENRLLKAEDFKNDAKDAGDMGSGHQVTVFYEIVPVGVAIDLPGVDKSKYTIPTKLDPNAADEWLTVKMRYKQPDADVSKELAKVLPGKALGLDLSEDFRFAAAAASFGMILRDSQFRGAMTYAGVLEEAQGCVGADPNGHRKEFLKLVAKAKELTTKPAAPAVVPDVQN
ncbi:MAG: VWA domain-containing protein [Planctomycetes bacterium]|nr:VWA domain-containing protein [Planctomycetota bacterium]